MQAQILRQLSGVRGGTDKPGGATSTFFAAALEQMPLAVFTCSADALIIDFANAASVDLLDRIAGALPVHPDEILGQPITVLGPELELEIQAHGFAQGRTLETRVTLGEEVLSLQICRLATQEDEAERLMVTWDIITQQLLEQKRANRLTQMVENMPINVMTCDTDFVIDYVNQASIDTLGEIKDHLPVGPNDVVGQSVDIFHKHPPHQRALLSDPSNLPHQATFNVGPERVKLKASAMVDEDGSYLGPMVNWAIITREVTLGDAVTEATQSLQTQSQSMDQAASDMQTIADDNRTTAASVAAAVEEMSAAIGEITKQLDETARFSTGAVQKAEVADEAMSTLGGVLDSISEFAQIIDGIAGQTKLLALNATIEAARAGEAGRGFGVVAEEVRSLSAETAKATASITQRIGDIRTSRSHASSALEAMSQTIRQISEISVQVAAAMEEQSAATSEISSHVNGFSNSSDQAGLSAREVREAASETKATSEALGESVAAFMEALA